MWAWKIYGHRLRPDGKLQATLSKPGHAIQTLFEYDPENSGERIAELLQPSRLTAHNLGLHIGPLLEDWGHACNASALWKSAGLLSGHGPTCCPAACGKPL